MNASLNAQKVDNFVEKVGFDLLHREASAEGVNNGFAAAAREIDFNIDAEAFLGDKYSGIVVVLFGDAKGAKVFVGIELATLGETLVV